MRPMIYLCVMTRRQLSWIRGFSWSMGASDVKYVIPSPPPTFLCLSSGRYGSARKVFHFITVLDNSGYLMLEIFQSLSSVSCKSFALWPASGIYCCLVEALKAILAAGQYASTPTVRGGGHIWITEWGDHLTADTPIVIKQTLPWS